MYRLLWLRLGDKSGYTMRFGSINASYGVAFLGGEKQVWLFRDIELLRSFTASDVPLAQQWRSLGQRWHWPLPLPTDADRFDHHDFHVTLRQNRFGDLGARIGWCSEIAAEFALHCELPEVLDLLDEVPGPKPTTFSVHRWRQIIPLLASCVLVWDEHAR
ncbi:hypothetical protein AB0I53_21020 [Saccharopolyspora sp. NPDC050389]|uniref:hypothetical protein n=1 Tax=Saccharopolyspora sp. NPDC050389 TaxID=3155516 RepID=UPI003408E0D1